MIIDPAVNVACQAFLAGMMQESIMRYPNRTPDEHTIPRWNMMTVKDRMILQRAMAAALSAAKSVKEPA